MDIKQAWGIFYKDTWEEMAEDWAKKHSILPSVRKETASKMVAKSDYLICISESASGYG